MMVLGFIISLKTMKASVAWYHAGVVARRPSFSTRTALSYDVKVLNRFALCIQANWLLAKGVLCRR